jgi:cytoskeletal protein RodZ
MTFPDDKALNKAIGQLLREHRQRLNITIDLAASYCNITPKELEKIEAR